MVMRVGIDGHFATRLPRRGIGTYALNLINAITSTFPNVEFYIYIRHPDSEMILPNLTNVKIRLIKAFADPVWEQVMLPLALSRDSLDVFHSLGNTGPLVMPRNVCHVLSLMDVMFLHSNKFLPKPTNFYQIIGRLYRSLIAPKVAKNSDAIITISEYSKNDILKMINSISENKISVVNLDCDPLFKEGHKTFDDHEDVIKLFGLKTPFILCLGADDPRKNTLRIILSYIGLVQNHNINEDLVLVGYKNWESSFCYREVLRANLTARVHFLPFVSTANLVGLYRGAKLFLYPSLYEGFGIPLLEAFNLGCPVIASNTTSIPEVGCNAPLYIDPESLLDLNAAIFSLIKNSQLRLIMKERGLSRAKDFSWRNVAMKTMGVYKQCTISVRD